jgi:Ran GTPase-activating protein (RanGAP) involved in mRNA processing and transport
MEPSEILRILDENVAANLLVEGRLPPQDALAEAFRRNTSVKFVTGEQISVDQIPAFAAGLRSASRLEGLRLNLQSDAVIALCRELPGLKLKELFLEGPYERSALETLFPALASWDPLELGLHNLLEDDEACECLAAVLKEASVKPRAQKLWLKKTQRDVTISERGLRALSLVLLKTQDLRELHLGFFGYDDKALEALAEGLAGLPSLRVLDLNDNCLRNPRALLSRAKFFEDLRELHLGSNELNDEGAATVAKLLSDSKVETFDLEENAIGDVGALVLSVALKTAKELKTLKLSGNPIESTGIVALAVSLAGSKIQELELSGIDMGEEGAKALAVMMATTRELRTLALEETGLGDAGAACIATGLASSLKLQTLRLRRNFITEAGMRDLASSLKKSKSLRDLELTANPIRQRGAEHLARALSTSALQRLCVSDCSLELQGAKALVEALKTAPSLQELNLSRNSLGNEGAELLASALKTCALNTLNASACEIEGEGVLALAAGIPGSLITQLALESTWDAERLDEASRAAIEAALRANRSRSFVLQMQADRQDKDSWQLSFRTLAGTLAAVLSCDERTKADALPELILQQMGSLDLPWTPAACSLQIVKPNGDLLSVRAFSAGVLDQLQSEKRRRLE